MVGAIAGAIIGAAVLAAFIGLGLLLSSRVGTPTFVLDAILGPGVAYAGFVVGVIVFSAVRGSEPDSGRQQSCNK